MTSLIPVMLVAVALMSQGTAAPERPLAFSDGGWELQGDRTAVVKENGRDVLAVATGFAHRRDVQLQDGTIDLDVQVTNRRSFVYIYFREVADGEREEFYLRPHKSSLPDAVQYAPVWQGRSSWQLYHGPGGTSAVEFEPGAWTHVRVAVNGSRAALFVKNMDKPVLVVPRLAREPRAGSISLGGFLPPGTPGEGPIARFADVTIRPGPPAFDLEAAARAMETAATDALSAPGHRIVRTWSVSRSFVPKEAPGASPVLPGQQTLGEFQRIETYPSGLLELHRHIPAPKDSRDAAAVARVLVRAAKAGTYTFDLGFSDIATVFLNGRPIFRGNASYSYDRPRREGLIEYEQARLFLPLNAGENDLSIVVADGFGGWGLMGRFVDPSGLTIE